MVLYIIIIHTTIVGISSSVDINGFVLREQSFPFFTVSGVVETTCYTYAVCNVIFLVWSDIMSDQVKLWLDITNSWADIHNVYM